MDASELVLMCLFFTTMRYFELFSGIGGFRQAINLLSKDRNIEMECAGFAEIDPYARDIYKSYFKPGVNEAEIANIIPYRERLSAGLSIPVFPGKKPVLLDMGSIDLLVGDVPCERYNDNMGLLNEVLWVLDVCNPEFVLLEAPKNITTFDKGNSMQTIVSSLTELGYYCFFTLLDAAEYGIPQTRKKVYIFGSKTHVPYNFDFCNQFVKDAFWDSECNSTFKYKTVHDILETPDSRSACWINPSSLNFIFATEYNGKRLYPSINLDPIMSIKPGASKMLRANADNYFSKEFVESKGVENAAMGKTPEDWKKLEVRRLTIKESVLFQGFNEIFNKCVERRYAPDTVLYKVIGSSTCVNTAYAALNYIAKLLNWK